MARVQLARVVVHDGEHEHQLQIGHQHIGRGAHEGPRRGERRGDPARALAAPFQRRRRHAGRAARRHAESLGAAGHAPGLHIVDVVLQVLPHARQRMGHGDAVALQFLLRADARQQQQLRRAERAAAQYRLAPRTHLPQLAALVVGHARGAPAVEQHTRRHGLRDHLQVGPRQMGCEKGLGGAATLAVALRHLVEEGALLLRAVVVRVGGEAVHLRSLLEHLVDGAVVARVGHVQRAALAVEGVGELLVVLAAPEQRQHLVVRPAGVAQRGPVVVVPAVAAHVEHGVDGAGAAQHLAARLVAAPPVQARLRHRLEGVVAPPGGHDGDHPGRGVDQHAAVGAARFQQADAGAGVIGQAGGQRTARRARAGDDVVEFFKGVHGVFFRGVCSAGSPAPSHSRSTRRCTALPKGG